MHPGWPLLGLGCDDVAAMRFLHVALGALGFSSGEEEEAEWYFGPGTETALLTFQACTVPALPETGVTDPATWAALLGEAAVAEAPPFPLTADVEALPPPPPPPPPPPLPLSGGIWPAVRRDDGGTAVGALQALLMAAGYNVDEDDVRYWHFGDATEQALRTFQACHEAPRLVESGVADPATWRALLGEDRFAAGPTVLATLVREEDDMNRRGVWLMGEDRWERAA